MTITDELRGLVIRTAKAMAQGAGRRRYMADTLKALDLGQREAQSLFGWGRDTIRKALHEQRTGISCCDAFSQRGRKRAEDHLPRLLEDIRDLAEEQCQTDGTFRTTRLYCRLSVATVRRQLIAQKGYSSEELPTIQTLTTKMNNLGFRLRKVAKSRPQKKFRRPMRSSRT
jgi:transposase